MADYNKGELKFKIKIEGIIHAKTGLHIGGSNTGLSIGGADAVVIRNPLDNQPYIPGSSLKGKMRSLLEKLEFKFGTKMGKDIQKGPFLDVSNADELIPRIFGTTPEAAGNNHQPITRLIVRDCALTSASARRLDKVRTTDMQYTEVKTEVVIDRITSAAMPRQLERVPAGAQFNMQLILNIFDGDDERKMVSKVLQALCLVQDDYLGGKGTRGSGEVAIHIENLAYRDKSHYEAPDSGWSGYTDVSIPTELRHPDLINTQA